MPPPPLAPVLHTPRLTLTLFDWSTPADPQIVLDCFNDAAAIAAHGDFGFRDVAHLRALEAGVCISPATLTAAYEARGRTLPEGGLTSPPLPWYVIHLGHDDPDGERIGSITMMESRPAVPHIGWQLLHQHAGNGYATEAAKEVLRYWREDFGLGVVMALTNVENRGSYRIAEKLGMERRRGMVSNLGEGGAEVPVNCYLTPGAPDFAEGEVFEFMKT